MGRPPVLTEMCAPATEPVCQTMDIARVDLAEVDRAPHRIEREVQHLLSSQPGLRVSSLVVRRVGNGVCLTGVIESMDDQIDLSGLVKEVAGVDDVMNRLLVRSCTAN